MKSCFQVRIVRKILKIKKIMLKGTEKEKFRHELQSTLVKEAKSSQKRLT